jgi:hypothetical protein
MTTTERIEAQVARQREVLHGAADALTNKAADALQNLDVAAAAGRAADTAGRLADDTAAGLRNTAASKKSSTGRRLVRGFLVLGAVAVALAWLRRRA